MQYSRGFWLLAFAIFLLQTAVEAAPSPTSFPTLNFASMPLTLVQTVVSTSAQLTVVPPLTIVPRIESSLNIKGSASTVKESKRQEVLDTNELYVPSPRKLQQQTSLPTIAGYSVGPSYMSFWNSYTFTGLGNNAQRTALNPQQRYYLQSMFIEAGFGGAAEPSYSANGMIKQQLIRIYAAVPVSPFGYVQVAICNPKKRRTDCSTGLPERSCFTPDGLDWWPVPNAAISDAQGGSLQLVFATEGFLSAPCSTSIQVRYTLSGSPSGISPGISNTAPSVLPSTVPTLSPTTAVPTALPTSLPSSEPTQQPTNPTGQPSGQPSRQPSSRPSRSHCRPGQFVLHPNMTESLSPCGTCPSGKYSSKPESVECTPCQPGTFSAKSGTSQCSSCGKGALAAKSGMSQCLPSPVGSYVDAEGASSYSLCSTGTFADTDSTKACTPCPAGKFAPKTGLALCVEAPPGSFVSGLGFSSITSCDAGTFAGAKGSQSCIPCPKDFYMEESGAVVCTQCPPGTLTPFEGAASANICLSPVSNFAFGTFAAAIAIFVAINYVIFGRFRLASFLRRERVVMSQVATYRDLMKQLREFEETIAQELWIAKVTELAHYIYAEKEFSRAWQYVIDVVTILFFAVVSIFAVVFSSVLIFGIMVTAIFFKSLIIYKQNGSFLNAMPYRDAIGLVCGKLVALLTNWHFPNFFIAPVEAFLSVLRFIFDNLALFSINLGALNVTCEGAKAPFAVLFNLVILGGVVLIVDSQIQTFRGLVFRTAIQKYSSIVLSREYRKYTGDHNLAAGAGTMGRLSELLSWGSYWLQLLQVPLVQIIAGFFDFSGVLQFLLAEVQLSIFVSNSKTHTVNYTDTCNTVPGAENFDAILAYITTAIAFMCFTPVFYEVAKVITPNDSRAVQTITYAKRKLALLHASEDEDSGKKEGAATLADSLKSPMSHLTKWSYLQMPFTYLAPDLLLAHLTNGFALLLKHTFVLVELPAAGAEEAATSAGTRISLRRMSVSAKMARNNQEASASGLAAENPMIGPEQLSANAGSSRRVSALPGDMAEEVFLDYAERFERSSGTPILRHIFETLQAYIEYASITLVPFDPATDEGQRWRETQFKVDLPNYFDLLLYEANSLFCTPKPGKASSAASLLFSYLAAAFLIIFPIGHVFTPVGRDTFRKILFRFRTFFLATLGYWDNNAVHSYDISGIVDSMAVDLAGGSSRGEAGVLSAANEDQDRNRVNQRYAQTIEATIAPRAILLQLVPWFTIWSIFSIATAPSAIFASDPELLGSAGKGKEAMLFPLFIWDCFERAKKEDEGKFAHRDWITVLSGVKIFVNYSRAIQFVLSAYMTFVSVFILFAPTNPYLLASLVLILFPIAIVRALDLVLILGKTLNVKDLKDVGYSGNTEAEVRRLKRAAYTEAEAVLAMTSASANAGANANGEGSTGKAASGRRGSAVFAASNPRHSEADAESGEPRQSRGGNILPFALQLPSFSALVRPSSVIELATIGPDADTGARAAGRRMSLGSLHSGGGDCVEGMTSADAIAGSVSGTDRSSASLRDSESGPGHVSGSGRLSEMVLNDVIPSHGEGGVSPLRSANAHGHNHGFGHGLGRGRPTASGFQSGTGPFASSGAKADAGTDALARDKEQTKRDSIPELQPPSRRRSSFGAPEPVSSAVIAQIQARADVGEKAAREQTKRDSIPELQPPSRRRSSFGAPDPVSSAAIAKIQALALQNNGISQSHAPENIDSVALSDLELTDAAAAAAAAAPGAAFAADAASAAFASAAASTAAPASCTAVAAVALASAVAVTSDTGGASAVTSAVGFAVHAAAEDASAVAAGPAAAAVPATVPGAPTEPANDAAAEQAAGPVATSPWQEVLDAANGTYYYNAATDESVWEPPAEGFVPASRATPGPSVLPASTSASASAVSAARSPWQQMIDASSGDAYYWNEATQESLWDAPPEGFEPAPAAATDPASSAPAPASSAPALAPASADADAPPASKMTL